MSGPSPEAREPATVGGEARRFDPEAVFAALADGTRREILHLLRDRGPLRSGALAAAIDRVSPQAVSNHLRVLREAGLVTVEEEGRSRIYRLDAGTLRALAEIWFEPFEAYWRDRLDLLRRLAEIEDGAEA